MNRKTKQIRTCALMLLLLAFSVVAWIGSFRIYQKHPGIADSGAYPLLMSSLMILCLVISLVQLLLSIRKENGESGEQTKWASLLLAALKEEFPPRTVFLGACIIGYGILFHFFGFYISTAVFLMVSIVGLYRGKKIPLALGVTAISLVSVYLIIEKVFNIMLP